MKRLVSAGLLWLVVVVGFSLTDSYSAAANPPESSTELGAQLWTENCTACHETKPHIVFDLAKLEKVRRHIREETDLNPAEQEAILEFLQSRS